MSAVRDLVLRRSGAGLLGMLALTFGMMAATGLPLSPVTATLTALSISIGMPFTIHVSSRYLEEREVAGGQGPSALRRAVAQTGRWSPRR